MATICNMGAEVGATTSIFPFTPSAHIPYLQSTHRASIAEQAAAIASSPGAHNLLVADSGAEYDDEVVINLSELEPHINGPFTPDLSTPISMFKQAVEANDWPKTFGAGLIGSCTNSSYADMTRAESLVRQASAAGLQPKADFFITPGSEQIRATVSRDGTMETFEQAGGVVLSNACGPCIGQWSRTDGVKKGEANAIFTSYNRNFPGRNDGNRGTMNFLASPELVTAMSFSGRTDFNPITDGIPTPGTCLLHDYYSTRHSILTLDRRQNLSLLSTHRHRPPLRRLRVGQPTVPTHATQPRPLRLRRHRSIFRPPRRPGTLRAFPKLRTHLPPRPRPRQRPMHNRHHLRRRPLAQIQRPPPQHQREHAHRRRLR